MFYDFSHRYTACMVDGTAENVVLTRDNKSSSVTSKEYAFAGLFAPDSVVTTGSMADAGGNHYLVQSVRPTADGDKYTSLVKTNVTVDVQRWSLARDAKRNPTGDAIFTTVSASIIGFAQFVTAQLRQQDAGLLPTTTYTLLVQSDVDVKRPQDASIKSPDRILLNVRPYQVDVIDDIRYPGLLYIQLSEDIR